jgi:hypothetical protein
LAAAAVVAQFKVCRMAAAAVLEVFLTEVH